MLPCEGKRLHIDIGSNTFCTFWQTEPAGKVISGQSLGGWNSVYLPRKHLIMFRCNIDWKTNWTAGSVGHLYPWADFLYKYSCEDKKNNAGLLAPWSCSRNRIYRTPWAVQPAYPIIPLTHFMRRGTTKIKCLCLGMEQRLQQLLCELEIWEVFHHEFTRMIQSK